MVLGVPILKHFRVYLVKEVPIHEVPCIAMATAEDMSD